MSDSSSTPAPHRAGPPDRLRLPTLTEELDLPEAVSAPPVQVPVLKETYKPSVNSPPLDDTLTATRIAELAARPIVASPMAADEQRAMQTVAATVPPLMPELKLPEAVLASTKAPVAAAAAVPLNEPRPLQLNEPRPLPDGPPPMLAPWVHTVVKDAIDEALAHAMPQLVEIVNAHVRKRLEEASRNPNRNLF
jgi:hypothetical protein